MHDTSTASILSVSDTFRDKNILLIGATGFLGKVLLTLCLDQVPTFNRIYVLMRAKNARSTLARFVSEIVSSPVFSPLRQKYGDALDDFLEQRVKILVGDVTEPSLGLSANIATYLQSQVDVVINASGLVDFSPDIEQGLAINTLGAMQVAEFVQACDHAKLVHVSTCYVASKQDGTFGESVSVPSSSSGEWLDPMRELAFVKAQLELLTLNATNDEALHKAKIELGKSRATYWRYSNTYCYTKALAELILTTRYAHVPHTIVRPSIIESALSFPMTGWNEGYNTTAPISYLLGGWYPHAVVRGHLVIDIIPVDTVCRHMLLITTALLQNKAAPVYQLATSVRRPVLLDDVVRYIRTWHQRARPAFGWRRVIHYLRTRLRSRGLAVDALIAPQPLALRIKRLEAFLRKLCLSERVGNIVTKPLSMLATVFFRIAKIYRVFQPFIYDHAYQFESTAISRLRAVEPELNDDVACISWEHYWLHVHMPGLNQWIFPKYVYAPRSQVINEPVLSFEHLAPLIFAMPEQTLSHACAN